MNDEEHNIKCNTCGQTMHAGDLSQVFAHESCEGVPIDYMETEPLEYSSFRKIGNPTLHIRNIGALSLN